METHDYAAIKQVAEECRGESQGTSTGPFARLGWFNQLRDWIEAVIEPMGFHLRGEFRQFNASESFSLVRFETSGPALWFKAVGEPNQREFAITSALAKFFPDCLPRILASRPDWNGWLTSEVQGTLLSDFRDCVPWERAAADLARLQIQSIDRASKMLGAGARDLGSAALSQLIQPFIDVVAQLMEHQTKIPPPVLGPKDLSVLTESLSSSLKAMEATPIPDTLGHLDLNPGNIIVSGNRCAFLDWAEAYVGNPLFSLEYLLQHAGRAFRSAAEVRTKLVAAYCAQWNGVVSSAAIADALVFAPLLAVFAYAVGSDAWQHPQRLPEPVAAGYLRSLARRMRREADELADRRSACPA
jgi:hypothetical protein